MIKYSPLISENQFRFLIGFLRCCLEVIYPNENNLQNDTSRRLLYVTAFFLVVAGGLVIRLYCHDLKADLKRSGNARTCSFLLEGK